jgi:hypothetical protein
MMPVRNAVLAVALSSSLGCASSYMPLPSPRVALVLEGGNYAYVRDGIKYEGGAFGGDIDKVVEGNPQAEKYAQQYKTGRATGFTLTMLGLAGVLTGVVILSAQASQQPPGDNSVPATGLVVGGVGLVVETIGAIMAGSAMPHLFDAVNVYNDGLKDVPPARSTAPARPAD